MKKFLVLLFILVFGVCVKADMQTLNSKGIKYYGIGVVNLDQDFNIYKSPDINSEIIRTITIENNKKSKKSSIVRLNTDDKVSYIAYFPKKI